MKKTLALFAVLSAAAFLILLSGIRSVNGWGVRVHQDITTAIRDKKAGETVTVEFVRDGQVHRTEVPLRARRELTGE